MSYKFDVDKIDIVEQRGFRSFMFVEPHEAWYGSYQRAHFYEEYKVILPTESELQAYGSKDKLRIMTDNISFNIKFKDTSWLQFEFRKGFVTDFASVPKSFRSVVDNDDNRIVCAALVHDYLFTTHGLPFKYTNELFHQMMLAFGYNRARARLAYWAVKSYFGRKYWRKETPKRIRQTRKTAQMLMPRPIEVGGKTYDNLPILK